MYFNSWIFMACKSHLHSAVQRNWMRNPRSVFGIFQFIRQVETLEENDTLQNSSRECGFCALAVPAQSWGSGKALQVCQAWHRGKHTEQWAGPQEPNLQGPSWLCNIQGSPFKATSVLHIIKIIPALASQDWWESLTFNTQTMLKDAC